MRELLTPGIMFRELERMNAVFTKYAVDDLKRLAVGYLDALRDLDSEQLTAAIGMCIRSEARFPVPAKIREHASEWTKHHRPIMAAVPARQDINVDAPVCAVCKSVPRLAWLEARHWKTGEISQVQRIIAPCNPRLHEGTGMGTVPFPENFLGFVETGETA